jgi:starch phosphorylase
LSASPSSLAVPEALERLPELARNLWWSWHPEARDLFRLLDETLWREIRHNPVRLLREIAPERLARAAEDPDVRRRYATVVAAFDRALSRRGSWCMERYPGFADCRLAFFSAEYGLHTSLPFYAGGLGVLAGDISKEASDLGIPFVGIGFMYPQGYFRQHINPDGRQEEAYEHIDRNGIPVTAAIGPGGGPITIELPLPDRTLHVAVWQVEIGRSVLFLMDTDLDSNAPWDRELTGRLYGGDQTVRFLQEIVLGIGGVRVLRALGIEPTVWHANEGHTALMMVERLTERLAAGMEFDRAVEEIRASTVFTTHTPVPAGHDAFPFTLVESFLPRIAGTVMAGPGMRERILGLAVHEESSGPAFNMTVLSLRLSGHVNGVSRRHSEISRAMWSPLWPALPEREVPIGSITNGVHVPTWISGEMNLLLRARIGADWIERHDDPAIWERLSAIPDDALWATRKELKHALLRFVRERVRSRWSKHDVDPGQGVAFGALLDPDALTIGFARRFASYKRAFLVLRDPARLRSILTDSRRPVQIIFAGKAHPADEHGKQILASVYRMARDPATAGRIAILEDYDMHMAHWLVQGVDLWLNNPRPPYEASGTSGMKAAINGVPSLSIPDGWWAEGYDGGNGWTFGGDTDGWSDDEIDARDAEALYRTLQEIVVPLFYDRNGAGIPHGWLHVVRRTIHSVTPAFSARRMVKEYVERMYAPAVAEIAERSR